MLMLPHYFCAPKTEQIAKPVAVRQLGPLSMEHARRTRRYYAVIPEAVSPETKLPLLLALHGAPGHGANMAEFSGLREQASIRNFIAVFPDGTSARDPVFLNWNTGTCCGYARDNNIDDLGFLRRLIEKFIREYPVDPERVYMAGFSKGGMMAYYFACQHADLLAGIAVVAGAFNLSECNPVRPLDVLIVHGRADTAIPYGGELKGNLPPLRDTEDRPVAYATHFWRKVNHCHPAGGHLSGRIEFTDYPCFRAALRLISLLDEGHTWPGAQEGLIGAEKPRGKFSVNEAMWSFWQESPQTH